MSARRKRILVVVGSVAIFFMSLAAIVLSTGGGVPTPPAITFVGLTNAAGKNTAAIFSIKNRYARPVSFFPLEPQVRASGDWASIALPMGGPTRMLEPDGEANFIVNVPVDASAWRVPVLWSIKPSRLEHFRYKLRNNWIEYREKGTILGWRIGYGVESFTNYTPEISGPENKAVISR
jgi:hypothetical protein